MSLEPFSPGLLNMGWTCLSALGCPSKLLVLQGLIRLGGPVTIPSLVTVPPLAMILEKVQPS